MTTFQIARADGKTLEIQGKMANRHGLIAGATGTGKTVTLRRMAEAFSSEGVPVFLVDVKGDLSGIAQAGANSGKVGERIAEFDLGEQWLQNFPVRFWDVYGETGIPVRVTVSEMGPMLLARLMNLNDTQEGLLNLVFKVADDRGWHILDLKDLRSMLKHVSDHASEYRTQYGNVSAASIGAIQRQLLTLENEGAEKFFGEPSLNLQDWMQTDNGKGIINILNSEKLMRSPRMYSAFLLWMLAELFETLPEVGDLDKPKFVMFFDEAHLMFDNAANALVEQIEQVVRLIRSKGVGVYFITQNPLDVPESVLGQLGNRVQHALRAFTPRDQKAVRTAAETMRANPALDTAKAISELGVGEALVSFLDAKGTPGIVERVWIATPASRIGPATTEERQALLAASPVAGVYEQAVDRESAYEVLRDRAAGAAAGGAGASKGGASGAGGMDGWGNHGGSGQAGAQTQGSAGSGGFLQDALDGLLGGVSGSTTKSSGKTASRRSDSVLETAAKSMMRSVGSQVGRALVRGILGSLTGKSR